MGVTLALRPEVRRGILGAVRSRWNRQKRAWGWGFLILFGALSVLPGDQTALREKGLPTLSGQKASLSSTVTSVFTQDLTKDSSAGERLAFWRNSLRMVADHPLLGVGPGGWAYAYIPHDGGATVTANWQPRNPHNDYLWIAAEYGLLGLAAYLWFLLTGFRCLLKMAGNPDPSTRIAAAAFALSLLALLTAAFFGFPREQAQTALLPYLLFGIAAGVTAGEKRPHPPPSPPSPTGRGRGDQTLLPLPQGRVRSSAFRLFPYLLLILSLGAVEISRRRVGFDGRYLNAVKKIQPPEDWRAALFEADRALAYGTFRPHILYLRGVALESLGRPDEAADAYRKALACAPQARRPIKKGRDLSRPLMLAVCRLPSAVCRLPSAVCRLRPTCRSHEVATHSLSPLTRTASCSYTGSPCPEG